MIYFRSFAKDHHVLFSLTKEGIELDEFLNKLDDAIMSAATFFIEHKKARGSIDAINARCFVDLYEFIPQFLVLIGMKDTKLSTDNKQVIEEMCSKITERYRFVNLNGEVCTAEEFSDNIVDTVFSP